MSASGSHWLRDRLSQHSSADALVYRDTAITYGQLAERIDDWIDLLERRALPAASVVGIRGDYSPGACALVLAVAFHRAIAATLPAGEDVGRYVDAAHAELVFEFQGDQWSEQRAPEAGARPLLLSRLADRGVGGLVVWSSGSTGRAKAALFDWDVLVERYRQPRRGYRTLVFLQLDHLGGLHTMLHTLAHGGTLVINEDRQPDSIAAAIERHLVELLPTTPTFLRMLMMARVHERHDLSSLRLITYGTEPMPASTLAALRRAFPDVRLKQTYGLTELGVLPTRSREPGSLWIELGGLGCEARVVDHVLWLRSATAMVGYLDAPSPFDEEGWYNTHDAVEVDGPYIRILGRTTDLINVGGQKVHPSEVESALLELDGVSDATVWGEDNPVTGQVVAARITLTRPEDPSSLERRIHAFCRGRLAAYKIPAVIDIAVGDHYGARFKKLRRAAAAAGPRLLPR